MRDREIDDKIMLILLSSSIDEVKSYLEDSMTLFSVYKEDDEENDGFTVTIAYSSYGEDVSAKYIFPTELEAYKFSAIRTLLGYEPYTS